MELSPDDLIKKKAQEYKPKLEKTHEFVGTLRSWIAAMEIVEAPHTTKETVQRAAEMQITVDTWAEGVTSCLKRCRAVM